MHLFMAAVLLRMARLDSVFFADVNIPSKVWTADFLVRNFWHGSSLSTWPKALE
jgi:hypothetical protein